MKVTLRELLKSKNMTQAELAELTGIRPSTISDLCNNVAERFKFSHLDSICRVLKCDITAVFKL